jgi:hypothetical protein
MIAKIKRSRKLTNVVMAAMLAFVAVLGVNVATAQSASASASGCTPTEFVSSPALVCNDVLGAGLAVIQIQGTVTWPKIYSCDLYLTAWGTLENGTRISWSGKAGCSVAYGYVDWNFQTPVYFKNGTSVCVAIDGRTEDACVTIRG